MNGICFQIKNETITLHHFMATILLMLMLEIAKCFQKKYG